MGPLALAVWSYKVTVALGGGTFAVEATLPPGTPAELSVAEGAEPFIRDVELKQGDAWKTVKPRQGSWFVPECKPGCVVRYRVELSAMADQAEDLDVSVKVGKVVVGSPRAWLLHPVGDEPDAELRLSLDGPGAGQFAVGWPRVEGSYRAHMVDLWMAPYAVVGPIDLSTLDAGGTPVQLALTRDARTLPHERVMAWLSTCVEAVRRYLGAFPAKSLLLIVLPAGGSDLNGVTIGSGGSSIVFWLGTGISQAEMTDSWVLVHELSHLMLPSVQRQHHWLEEGLATYVEPLARLRVGTMTPESLWSQLLWGLPQGMPQRGDQGLDNTHTWGRTYWGGALFWFLADVRIRERTQNRCSVRDALAGIHRAGGSLEESWDIERVLAEGDRGVGGKDLQTLYAELADKPGAVDLPGLFKKLGVSAHGEGATLDPKAPLAWLRDGITSTAPSTCKP